MSHPAVALFFGGKGKPSKGDSLESEDQEAADGYDKVRESALDDLADVLNVSDDDREKFDDAMDDLVQACVEKMMDKAKKPAKSSKSDDNQD